MQRSGWRLTLRGIKEGAQRAYQRRLIAAGERPVFRVRYRRTDEGITFSVLELPSLVGSTTGRKGIVGAARERIALALDVPDDAFVLEVELDR